MSSDLPSFNQAGVPGVWRFTDRHGSTAEVEGDFLGMGSSHRPYHKHTFPPYAERGQHCSTCRWMEVRIFQEYDDPQKYLILKTGPSIVPGEERLTTFGWAETADAVIQALTSWHEDGKAFFDFVARRALEQASEYDDLLDRAYRAAVERVGA